MGRSSQLYSTLSKGVHWEFFTSVLVFDEFTVKSAIRDTCLLVGKLGLISHFVPTAFASLEPNEALNPISIFEGGYPEHLTRRNSDAGLILAAEECPRDAFERYHRFSSYDEPIIRKLMAHGPVLVRGGRGN